MTQHVFIVMPFGEKEGINFNAIYQDLIKPALLNVGLEPFRADEEILPGDIRADMFQELLMADLVIADLSINNPNAWYELGVRHGLRAQGVIQIRANTVTDKIPFDVCVDRTIHYHLKNGVPDRDHIENDLILLGKVALETLLTNSRRKPTSPVYLHLPYLKEPDWKSLRVKNADAFWQAHEQWTDLIEVARKNGKPGDIVVLADEAPTYALKSEAYYSAGNALQSLGQFKFALEQFEKALQINPDDLKSAQKKGLILGRIKKSAQAEQWLRSLSKKHPQDAETWALLGRTQKDRWVNLWREDNKSLEDMLEDAKCECAQLNEAIRAYRQGFIEQAKNYYAGINALTLAHLLQYLQDQKNNELSAMAGGVRWATLSELSKETINEPNYWARVTLADLELLVSDVQTIEKAYKYAITAARQDWFALDSSRQQLKLLQDLAFRPAEVETAIEVFDRAIDRLEKPKNSWQPRKVFLFSGHMIDSDDRKTARFPKEKEAIAAKAILKQLKDLGAGPEDLALCGGACGGDLLFAEAALTLGLHLELRLPFDIAEFLQHSISFAGDSWRDKFYKIKDNTDTTLLIMPDELGQLPENINPYERNNLWQLYSALSWGIEKVYCVCLWDGQGGDGPGGTRHMHNSIKQRTGQVYVLDTNTLFN